MRIEWTNLALDRVLEIAEFRFIENTQRAQTWMGAVIDHASQLMDFPNRGRALSQNTSRNIRRLLFKDVWIVYEVLEDHVLILTVRHIREQGEDDF